MLPPLTRGQAGARRHCACARAPRMRTAGGDAAALSLALLSARRAGKGRSLALGRQRSEGENTRQL